jgi:hypothetical protein
MTFTQGELVKYDDNVIGYIAGLFGPQYPGVYTVLRINNDNACVCWWKWGDWTLPSNTNPELHELCEGKRVYNFHAAELQKYKTKLGNEL